MLQTALQHFEYPVCAGNFTMKASHTKREGLFSGFRSTVNFTKLQAFNTLHCLPQMTSGPSAALHTMFGLNLLLPSPALSSTVPEGWPRLQPCLGGLPTSLYLCHPCTSRPSSNGNNSMKNTTADSVPGTVPSVTHLFLFTLQSSGSSPTSFLYKNIHPQQRM